MSLRWRYKGQCFGLYVGVQNTNKIPLKVPAVETLLKVLPQCQKKLGQNQDLELRHKGQGQVQGHTGGPGLRWGWDELPDYKRSDLFLFTAKERADLEERHRAVPGTTWSSLMPLSVVHLRASPLRAPASYPPS